MLLPSPSQLLLPMGAAMPSQPWCYTKIYLFKIHRDSHTAPRPCRGCVPHPSLLCRERLWAGTRSAVEGLRWPSSWPGSHRPAWPLLFPRHKAGPDNKFARVFKKEKKAYQTFSRSFKEKWVLNGWPSLFSSGLPLNKQTKQLPVNKISKALFFPCLHIKKN